jgi:hypothetical protein
LRRSVQRLRQRHESKENQLRPRRSPAESGPPSTDRPLRRSSFARHHVCARSPSGARAAAMPHCAADSVCSPASQEEGVTPGSQSGKLNCGWARMTAHVVHRPQSTCAIERYGRRIDRDGRRPCSASLPTPRVTTLGRPMANPTGYSARWIRLWPVQIVLIAGAAEPGCGHRYMTSLPV